MEGRSKLYALARAWQSKDYQRLLGLAQRLCGSFILISRHELEPAGRNLLRGLKPYLIDTYRTRTWPGTRLLGNASVDLHKCRLTGESAAIIRGSVASLWDWIGPQYPEDLSFLRPTGIPWFISITHERDAFFKINDNGCAVVEAAFGENSLRCVGEDQCPEEVY